MWRTFWKDYDGTYKVLEDFLNSIENDGYEPRFIDIVSSPLCDSEKERLVRRALIIGGGLLTATAVCAVTAGNLKYEAASERIVISCRDHKAPNLRLLNPSSGPVVVVDCEREK